MKRKVVNLISLMLVALVSFSSCQSSKLDDVNGGNEEIPSTTSGSIVFTFAAPRGLPTTYALHDAPEWDIKDNKILLYDFLASDETLVKVHELTLIPAGDAKYNVTLPLSTFADDLNGNRVAPNQNRKFLFVANAPKVPNLTRAIKLKDIKEQAIGTAQTDNASSNAILQERTYIPMVGMAQTSTLNNNYIIPINASEAVVELIRAVARIDIQTTYGPDFLNPNRKAMIIKGATLNNTTQATGVGEHRFPLNKYAAVNGVKTFAQIPTDGVKPDAVPTGQSHGVKGKLQKAFYLYETPQGRTWNETNVPTVKFQLEYDGNSMSLEVPFWQNGKIVDIKRNYLYTIVLGSVNPITQGATFAIVTDEWDAQEDVTHAIKLIAPVEGKVPLGFDVASQTYTADKAGSSSPLKFQFDSNFANTQNKFVASLKVGEDNSTPNWISVSNDPNTNEVIITRIDANNTGKERTAVILVKDSAFQDVYAYQLLVKQPAN